MNPNSFLSLQIVQTTRWLGCFFLVGSLVACAGNPGVRSATVEPFGSWAAVSGIVDVESPAPWQHVSLPGKQPTQFTPAMVDGRHAMAVLAESSASMLRQRVNVPANKLGQIKFSWKVPDLIATADMSQRDYDDSPVRIVLAFDGDRSQFSAKNATLNELTRLVTGEEMPYAVMMYVWSKQRPVGAIINSPRTDRIRKLVVNSGEAQLHQWVAHERDIAADYRQVFGEAPGRLIGMGIMTDTDNTRTTARAWYGPVQIFTK